MAGQTVSGVGQTEGAGQQLPRASRRQAAAWSGVGRGKHPRPPRRVVQVCVGVSIKDSGSRADHGGRGRVKNR